MKKTTKGLLSALLLTAMCGAVGCKPVETSTGTPSTGTSSSTVVNVEAQNLLSSIVDNGDGCYTVSEADGKTTVAFNKPAGKEWAAASIDVSGIANKDRMSTLRFKVSGVGKLLIKFEGDNGACEIGQFVIFDTESKYEWSLLDNSEVLAGAKKLLFFAQPGGTGEGQFTLSELTLTPDVAGDDTSYQIITNNYTNIKEGSNVYDGAASTFSFNKYWSCNDGDVHTFTEENGAVKVDWSKNPELDRSWAFAKSPISGAFGKFNYVNFKVKGTSGQSVMFKAENADRTINAEVKIPFNGEEQIYTLDLSAYDATLRQTLGQILMFAAPGAKEGSGTYYILDAYFSNTFDGINVPQKVNEYNGTDASFGINQYWHDGGDNVYSVTNEASPWIIEYNKGADQKWSSMKTLVSGKFGNFTKIRFGVKVDEGKTIMIKAANGCEVTVTGTGKYDDSYELDLTTLTVAQRNEIKEILIFAEPDTENVSGSFEIHWMSFDGYKSQTNEYVSGADFNVNANWQGDALFNVTEANGKTTVAWEGATNGNRWSNIYTPYTGDISNFGELEYSITLPANSAIRMSIQNGGGDLGDLVNDTNEAKTFTGYFDLSKFTKDQLAGTEKIMMFPLANIVPDGEGTKEANVVTSGTIEITRLTFVYGRTEIGENGVLDVKAGNWYATGKGYTFTAEENGMKVSYNETKGYWEMAIMRFDGASLEGFTKATLVFTGPAGVQCIFKLEGEKGGAAEAKYEAEPMTGAQQTAELDVSGISKDGAVKFIIFADFNASGEGITGDITIHSLTFKA